MTPQQIAQTIINLLEQQGQLNLLDEVIEVLSQYQMTQESNVTIESAHELSTAEVNEITDMISQKIGYEPNVETIVNAELLAGVRVTINDQLIDASLKTQIEQVFEKIH